MRSRGEYFIASFLPLIPSTLAGLIVDESCQWRITARCRFVSLSQETRHTWLFYLNQLLGETITFRYSLVP